MSRPRGSEAIDPRDVVAAIAAVRRRVGRTGFVSVVAVSTELGVSVSGFEAWAKRRELTGRRVIDALDKSDVLCVSAVVVLIEAGRMTQFVVPPELADQLRALARQETAA